MATVRDEGGCVIFDVLLKTPARDAYSWKNNFKVTPKQERFMEMT